MVLIYIDMLKLELDAQYMVIFPRFHCRDNVPEYLKEDN